MSRNFLPSVLMGMALIISGCGPLAASGKSQPAVETPAAGTATQIAPQETALPGPAGTATEPSPIAEATSRGDQLTATDPASVNLAAGVPTLVEFFRFT
jgi:hypothetical protein